MDPQCCVVRKFRAYALFPGSQTVAGRGRPSVEAAGYVHRRTGLDVDRIRRGFLARASTTPAAVSPSPFLRTRSARDALKLRDRGRRTVANAPHPFQSSGRLPRMDCVSPAGMPEAFT